MINKELYRGLFEVIGYMLTSARGLIDEPQLYGPFRLIDGVSRLCTILEKEESGYGVFFTKLKAKIEKKKYTVMSDVDTFVGMMDELVIDFSHKMNAK